MSANQGRLLQAQSKTSVGLIMMDGHETSCLAPVEIPAIRHALKAARG